MEVSSVPAGISRFYKMIVENAGRIELFAQIQAEQIIKCVA